MVSVVLPAVVTACDKVMESGPLMAATVVPAGMFAPVTDSPTTRPAVFTSPVIIAPFALADHVVAAGPSALLFWRPTNTGYS